MMRKGCLALTLGAVALCGTSGAAEFDLSREGVTVTVSCAPDRVDVGRDFVVSVSATAPIPDLRDRFRGFAVAEDFAEDPVTDADGRTTWCTRWRLVPEPCAKRYGMKPFAMGVPGGSFYTKAVVFPPPAAREAVTGGMEVDPEKDLPPLSWKLVRHALFALAGLVLLVYALRWCVRKIATAVKVHRMSPIQRAYYELERLIAKGLPGRGHYKDFYVELTQVVRRYIQRKYGIAAPNMTTEEFLRTAKPSDELRTFLESADLVKFAGVEATPEMADDATSRARDYLRTDDAKAPAGAAASKEVAV